jgi:hypothetical protein
MRRLLTLLLLMMLTLLAMPFAAQDNTETDNRLLAALALVPDTPNTRSELYFNDRLAITEAYPLAAMPTSFEQFETQVLDGDGPALLRLGPSVWWAVYFNNASDPLAERLLSADQMPEAVGFDYFDITATLGFGQPPENGLVLLGDFDPATIGAALAANDFTEEEPGLWCGPGGCENGTEIDFGAISDGNPFGGHLGRRQPTVVTPDVLMSAPVLDIVEGHLDAAAGGPSLADNPDFAAAATVAGERRPR